MPRFIKLAFPAVPVLLLLALSFLVLSVSVLVSVLPPLGRPGGRTRARAGTSDVVREYSEAGQVRRYHRGRDVDDHVVALIQLISIFAQIVKVPHETVEELRARNRDRSSTLVGKREVIGLEEEELIKYISLEAFLHKRISSHDLCSCADGKRSVKIYRDHEGVTCPKHLSQNSVLESQRQLGVSYKLNTMLRYSTTMCASSDKLTHSGK
jgi:hypothetical protein